jgi:hypothetical protein
MFRTFGNTVNLLGTSWRVLRDDGLMMFPLSAGFSLLAVLLYVLMAFEYGGTFDRLSNGFHILLADFIFLALAYLGASFVIAYFGAALVAAAHYRIVGGSPDFRLGLESANDRLGAIALWSVISCTVGLVIKPVASTGGVVGRAGGFFAELLGGWATFLVLPVMIVEGTAPLDAMRRSTEMFKETWGRHLVGNFGFGVWYVALFVGAVFIAAGFIFIGTSSGFAVLSATMLFALAVATLKCLETVFVVALYNYATVGESDGVFSEEMLRSAYVLKQAKGRFGPPPARRRAAA